MFSYEPVILNRQLLIMLVDLKLKRVGKRKKKGKRIIWDVADFWKVDVLYSKSKPKSLFCRARVKGNERRPNGEAD